MSLATRCPACDTCFKVVPDQLRLAQGWVRCGRCDEVFLATDHLIEPAPPTPQQPPSEPLPAASTDAGPHPDLTLPEHAPRPDVDQQPLDDLRPGDGTASVTEKDVPPATVPERVRHYVWDTGSPLGHRRRSPGWTAFWIASLIGGTVALALQAAHAWRHDIASRVPATRPVLQAMCQWVDCRVEPVRSLSDLSVESSQLSQWGGTIYRFAIVLRNRADVPLMLPMLDLTLTDVRGAVIARKALSLSDFGVTAVTIGARQELSLQGYLNAGDPGVAGYTIELFHP